MKISHTTRTIDSYNKNANKYSDKFDNYEVYQNKIKNFHNKYIPKGATILDLGCGPGNNIKTILDKDDTCRFTGVDLSTGMIRISRERFPQFNFLQQDIRRLELTTKHDVIIASFCIVHLSNEETSVFLNRISDFIVNNGCLYLSYMNGDKSGFESTSFSKEKIFFNYYSDQFINNKLEQNSFKVLEITKEDYMEIDGSITTDTFIYAKREI